MSDDAAVDRMAAQMARAAVSRMAAQMARAAIDYDPTIAAEILRALGWQVAGPGAPALDPADVDMVADELRALGWSVSPPEPCRSRASDSPGGDVKRNDPDFPEWLVEDGDGFHMLGGGRDE